MERFYRAACHYRAGHIVRLKSDCPLLEADLVDACVSLHLGGGADYTGNTLERSYPVGQDVEILAFKALEAAFLEARLNSEREHLTLFVTNRSERFKLLALKGAVDLSAKRWTLDRVEDYAFLSAVFRQLYPQNPLFGREELLSFLARHPELESLNVHISSDEGIRISLQSDSPP